ncbi:MAG: tetratricopeptide repeat protein, partial [Pseudomonadota bacterium]
QFFEGTKWSKEKVIVNHLNFNPSGTKIFALLRCFSASAPFPTISIIIDVETGRTEKVFGFGSHYHWKNDSEIIVSGEDVIEKSELTGMGLFALNVDTGEQHRMDAGFFRGDGHCSFSPNRRYVLYDSYGSYEVPYRRLQVYDTAQGRGITLFMAYSDPALYKEDNDCRCDLHPRWSPSGDWISFDSIHNGYRGIYRISVSDVIDALNRESVEAQKLDIFGDSIRREADVVNEIRRKRPAGGSSYGPLSGNRSDDKSGHVPARERDNFEQAKTLIDLANKQERQGKPGAALQALEAAAKISPNSANLHSALWLQSRAHQKLGNLTEALEAAINLASEDPGNLLYQRHERNLHNALGQFEEAIGAASAAAHLEPLSPDDWLFLARVLFKAGHHQESYEVASESSESYPSDPRLLDAIADAAAEMGQLSEAIDVLDKAVKLAPDAKGYSNKRNSLIQAQSESPTT